MDDLTLGARNEICREALKANGNETSLRPHLKTSQYVSQYKLQHDFFVCSSILAAIVLRRVGYTHWTEFRDYHAYVNCLTDK